MSDNADGKRASEIKRLKLSDISSELSPPLDPEVVEEWTEHIRGLAAGTVTGYGNLSPWALFSDITFMGSGPAADTRVKALEKHILRRGDCAFIDYDEELGWVFHSLVMGDQIFKKGIAERFKRPAKSLAELELGIEIELEHQLLGQGIPVSRQVDCFAGTADIVTPDTIYEIKYTLSGHALFQAIGQVLLYRAAINPAARAVVVGVVDDRTTRLIPLIQSIGVDVLPWPNPTKARGVR